MNKVPTKSGQNIIIKHECIDNICRIEFPSVKAEALMFTHVLIVTLVTTNLDNADKCLDDILILTHKKCVESFFDAK